VSSIAAGKDGFHTTHGANPAASPWHDSSTQRDCTSGAPSLAQLQQLPQRSPARTSWLTAMRSVGPGEVPFTVIRLFVLPCGGVAR